MTQLFREDGEAEAVTVIDASPCAVVQIKTTDRKAIMPSAWIRKAKN